VRKYEEFLEQVREKYPDEFTDIGDILTRYNTLQNSYTELTERKRKLEEESEALKRRKDELDKQSKESILELNINISHLQKRIDEAEGERMYLQKNVEQEDYLTSGKQLEMGNMISTIDNVFDRCRKALGKIAHDFNYRAKSEVSASEGVQVQVEAAKDKLKVINAYVHDLKNIVASKPKETKTEAAGIKTKARLGRQNP
jgi:chromosome segregation ATPase